MINYEWTIVSMQYAPSEDNLSKVVTNVYWRLVATEDGFMSYEEDYIDLPKADPNNYVAYEELKKEDVVSWIEQLIDVDSLKKRLADIIELQKNPPIIIEHNPFAPRTEIIPPVEEPEVETPVTESESSGSL